MASDFQSSFIPKGPVVQQQIFKKKGLGWSGMLVVLLLIISLVGAIGLYAYKIIIKKDIQNLESQLAGDEQNIDTKTINEMVQFEKKMQVTETIVKKHQIISNFLTALSSSTVSTVQFAEMNYANLKEGELSVNLHGKAADYSSVALQENVFYQNRYFKSISFSNLTLSDDGKVSFDIALSVDPQIAIYNP
jgi:uncharacterized membrane protein